MNLSWSSIVFDLIVVAIFVICALYYRSKGFLASLVNFVGTLAALVAAVLAQQKLSQPIFDKMFRPTLLKKTTEGITENGADALQSVIDQVLGFLPKSMTEGLASSVDVNLQNAGNQMSEMVVDKLISPIVVSLIGIILCLVVFMLVRVIFAVVVKALKKVNKIPALGSANKFFGLLMGILMAAIYTVLLLCVVWIFDAVRGQEEFGSKYFISSFVYNLTAGYNPFLA